MYTLEFAPQALEDLSRLKKSEPAAFKKAGKLLVELQQHPKTGLGKPEALSGDRVGQWSRRISQKHRLRICFEMVNENNYSLFFDRISTSLTEQWGSIVTEKKLELCEKEA